MINIFVLEDEVLQQSRIEKIILDAVAKHSRVYHLIFRKSGSTT